MLLLLTDLDAVPITMVPKESTTTERHRIIDVVMKQSI